MGIRYTEHGITVEELEVEEIELSTPDAPRCQHCGAIQLDTPDREAA